MASDMHKPATPILSASAGAALVCGVLFLNLPGAALAVDGTITINGEITDQTCKINGVAPPANIWVTLPKISRSALKTKGDVAGATPFQIALTECPATLSGEVRAYFEPGRTTDYGTGNLIAYGISTDITAAASSIPADLGTAKSNVQIQLANIDGSVIRMGSDASTQAARGETLQMSGATKSATLRYLARYVRTGDTEPEAGKLVSYVTYSILYP